VVALLKFILIFLFSAKFAFNTNFFSSCNLFFF
jgi:hypothetical protein